MRVNRALMLVWWRVRLARYLHDRERDSSLLIQRPVGWREEKEWQIRDYQQRATCALGEW